MELHTERLIVLAPTPEQILLLTEDIPKLEKELNVTYHGEAIEGHLLDVTKSQYKKVAADKENFVWYTFWQLILKAENTIIGSACFKGLPDENGDVEIGYGINSSYENKGYTTEAVNELFKLALTQKGVTRVIAETEKDNIASQKVLQKCGMKKYKETEECFWWELKRL